MTSEILHVHYNELPVRVESERFVLGRTILADELRKRGYNDVVILRQKENR
jgi:hypothetical protein